MGTSNINVILFGEFSLSCDGRVLAEKDYRSQKMWAVLAYLIMNRQRPVSQAELIQRFWDDEDGQNPAGALKTLIFRLRKLLLPLLGEDCQPVVSALGSYQWNPALVCTVDAEEFEALLHRCASAHLPDDERMECYRRALTLYRGEFLPKAVNLTWHTMRSAFYQTQYSQAACEYAALLEERGAHTEAAHICNQALHQGVVEEKLFVMLIRSLLHQGAYTQALQQYEKAGDILYHELGVARSSSLKSLYMEIMHEGMKEESDIAAILEDVRDVRAPGAFFCEYGLFKEIYRLGSRHTARTGEAACIALLTLSAAADKHPSVEALGHAMKALEKTLRDGLRQTDIVAQYSGRQFVVLLPATSRDDCLGILRRIEDGFHQNWYHRIVQLRWTVQATEASGVKGAAK